MSQSYQDMLSLAQQLEPDGIYQATNCFVKATLEFT